MWRVVLMGKKSGMEYVYHVQAGPAATLSMVEYSAYHQHGEEFARGVVRELVTSTPVEVEYEH